MNSEGRDLLSTPVPATQKTQVTSTHTACVPIDAIGRRDQSGSRKKRVYVPDVTVVQHPANLHDVNKGTWAFRKWRNVLTAGNARLCVSLNQARCCYTCTVAKARLHRRPIVRNAVTQ
jgi:hypothetical protein